MNTREETTELYPLVNPMVDFAELRLITRSNVRRGRAKSTVSTAWGETVFQGEGQYRPQTIGRNEPCTCGSGKKFKKCCIK